jgi:hypothetical protein
MLPRRTNIPLPTIFTPKAKEQGDSARDRNPQSGRLRLCDIDIVTQ